ncbi:MAG TPA: SCO family protein [Methylococcaceae bacterium]|nr:SCO family protein [Methylococcaceae bacterium]
MNRREFVNTLALGGAALGLAVPRSLPAAVPAGPRAGYFPNFELTAHTGRKVRFYDDLVRGKHVVINFIYTAGGDVCREYTENLLEVYRLLGGMVGRDVFPCTITLDPKKDTPAVLAEWARWFGVGPAWPFLTGQPAQLDLLRRKLGFAGPETKPGMDMGQHMGIALYGIEPLDRWTAIPVLSRPAFFAERVLSIRPPGKEAARG